MPTVYAAFNSSQAAAAAVEQLQSFGFSRSSIRDESDPGFRASPTALQREPGIMSTLEAFFAKLRNAPEPLPIGLYEETIRMGGAVLAVDAATPVEAQTARSLMGNAGAIDAAAYGARNGSDESAAAMHAAPDRSEIEAGDRRVAVGGLPLHKIATSDAIASLGTPASEADFTSFQSGSYEVREQVEVIRLTKVARVVEELTVDKRVTVYTETIQDTLRGTAVEVEEIPAAPQFGDSTHLPPGA